MAATRFQAAVLQRIARSRVKSGVTYVAGGLALNHLIGAPRLSHDIDVFNDTEDAVTRAFEGDTAALRADGFDVRLKRRYEHFAEATVSKDGESTDVQWAHDSAYRFFPLVEDPLLGLALHPFDLATNKMLALVGRRAPRDWIDAINCHERLQPLAFLVWAACGKDPGFSPAFMLEFAARTRYSQLELDQEREMLGPLDAAALSRKWHEMLAAARETLTILPAEKAGTCVVGPDGNLFRGPDNELRAALDAGAITFHEGKIGGAWPRIVER